MARMVLLRHADKIDDSAELKAMGDDLFGKYASSTTPGFSGSAGGRQSGGLALRARAAEAAEQASQPPPPGTVAEPVDSVMPEPAEAVAGTAGP
jgi:hypothetical protein